MCLITLSWQPASNTPLIIAANRDEFYARPAVGLCYWQEQCILAGKDLRGGGTWLGLGKAGGRLRLAALTNYRDINSHRTDAPTRGHITTSFLNGTMSAAAYLEKLASAAHQYNPFNLILFDGLHLMGFESRHAHLFAMQAGVTSVSNADFNTPWPKLSRLHGGFESILSRSSADSVLDEELFHLLSHDTMAPDTELPQTGIPIDRERALSAAFIRTPDYGTRASSVIRVGTGVAEFAERSFDASGFKGEVKEKFYWPSARQPP
jgi:uncharacterized protein with NRDE domain